MPLSMEGVLYGLRNLAVGDDEQTRIEMEDDDTVASVQDLIDLGDYFGAYRKAIEDTMLPEDEEGAVEISPLDCLCWALSFEFEEDWDCIEDANIPFLRHLLELARNHDNEDSEMAISLAFEMWTEYQDIMEKGAI